MGKLGFISALALSATGKSLDVTYLAGGYDEGPCRKGVGCTCVADDPLSAPGEKDYCLSWNPQTPFVKLPPGGSCPSGSDGPMTQGAAIAMFFDVAPEQVSPWPEQDCTAKCDALGANCTLTNSTHLSRT
jgi:hypothetical protein